MRQLTKLFPWYMWFLAALFFAYQFVLRLYPGLIIENISLKFQIDSTSFGILSSAYYYGYAGLQIPIAVLLDRYKPRYVLTLCALICGASMFLFAFTESWSLLLLSRFLIGAASAAGFLGTSKVISLWFPAASYARMVGISFSIGLVGALYGGRPLSHLVEILGWQHTAFVLFLLGGMLAFLIFLCLRSPSPSSSFCQDGSSSSDILNISFDDIKNLLKNKKFLTLAVSNLLMVGTLEGFADIWSVPYLMKTYGYPKPDAAFATSWIYIGMILGAPLLALCASYFKAYYEFTSLSGLLSAVLLGGLLFFHGAFPYPLLCGLLFLAGILCCYQVLVFAIGATLVSPALMGITIAFLNCINMLGGSFFHTAIGSLLDCFWDGAKMQGIPIYCALSYSKALWIIPICSLLGALLVFFIRPSSRKAS